MSKTRGRTCRKRKSRRSEVGDSCHSHHDVNYNLLSRWMGGKGYKPTKRLKPKLFLETGRGLMTKEHINSGDVILTIPESLLITTETVLKSELGIFFKKYCPKATGQQILSVFLMFEKVKGKTSDWHPYIETIPESYHIPAFYGQKCLKMLPTFIYKQSLEQIENINNSYDQLNLLIRNLSCSFPFLHNAMNFELYKWAWCSVNTRCVFINCFKEDCIGKSCQFHLAMAPFLDLLNHNVQIQIQAGFNKEKKQYEIISLCHFKKYSQVFINYGSHDNWTLFLEYGFVVQNNENDSVLFSRDDILSAYQHCKFPTHSFQKKWTFLMENDLMRNLTCSNDGLSWNLNIVLRILSSNSNVKWWKSRIKNYVEPVLQNQSDSVRLRREILQRKLDEFKDDEINIGMHSFVNPTLQLHISMLFSIAKSILINAMK